LERGKNIVIFLSSKKKKMTFQRKLLATGTYSEVYTTDDPKWVVKRQWINDTYIELDILSRFNHPCIVPLKDFDLSMDGDRIFLEMTLLRGKSSLHCNNIIHLAYDLLSAIAFLHEHGIYHGDITYANVVILPATDEYPERAALIDFGLAQLCFRNSDGDWVFSTHKLSTPIRDISYDLY